MAIVKFKIKYESDKTEASSCKKKKYKINKSNEKLMVHNFKTVITENCQEYNIQIESSVGPFSLLQKWLVSISVQWCVKNERNIINRKRGY